MLQIEMNCKNYMNFERIGYGSFSNVYRAEDKRNGYYVAIKEIDKKRFNKSKEIIENEIEIMKKIKNENSVELKEIIETSEYYYIIMDYCEYNLENYIKKRKKGELSINEIRNILIQLNNTLKLMLKENIYHRDLKPSNILISFENIDKYIIKLCDYGSSKNISKTMSYIGTPLTMSPEILNNEKDLSKSDLWSIGIIIYYLYFNEYPYNGNNEYMLFKDINSNKILKSINNNELNDLMNNLLKINIKERLSWDEYFNHKFFKQDISSSFNFKCKIHSQNVYI